MLCPGDIKGNESELEQTLFSPTVDLLLPHALRRERLLSRRQGTAKKLVSLTVQLFLQLLVALSQFDDVVIPVQIKAHMPEQCGSPEFLLKSFCSSDSWPDPSTLENGGGSGGRPWEKARLPELADSTARWRLLTASNCLSVTRQALLALSS
jgi:hypothetical protein